MCKPKRFCEIVHTPEGGFFRTRFSRLWVAINKKRVGGACQYFRPSIPRCGERVIKHVAYAPDIAFLKRRERYIRRHTKRDRHCCLFTKYFSHHERERDFSE